MVQDGTSVAEGSNGWQLRGLSPSKVVEAVMKSLETLLLKHAEVVKTWR